MDYLVFQIYAPLLSWGTQAVGQERTSEDHPGRSALLGLLAAALGIDRQDDSAHDELSLSCLFGIKQISAGLTLRDFHTTQVPPENKKTHHLFTRRDELREPKLGTVLSYRNYQQDSLHVVAVMTTGTLYSLIKLQQALQHPVFHLYFGRKSCPPAIPLNPEIMTADNLKMALDGYGLDEALRHHKSKPRYYWESAMESVGMEETFRVMRHDQPISRQRWQFTRREEHIFMGE